MAAKKRKRTQSVARRESKKMNSYYIELNKNIKRYIELNKNIKKLLKLAEQRKKQRGSQETKAEACETRKETLDSVRTKENT